MADDGVEAVEQLLMAAEDAHGTYEATELNGVYDVEWARWYAGFAVDHGIGDLLGHPVSVDAMAETLASGFAEFDATDPKPSEGWAAFVARRVVEQL